MPATTEGQVALRGGRNGRALLLGALLGMALAGYGVIAGGQQSPPRLDDQVIATVNGRAILRSDYERALAAVAADRRAEIDEAMRRHVLDRMIDEELLVQRGIELGLAERDRRVRADLSAAVIDLLSARGDPLPEPSEQELHAFYQEHLDYFRGAPEVRVEAWYVGERPGEDGVGRGRRTAALRQALTGQGDGEDLADPLPLPLPSGLMSAAKLGDYLGPAVARLALEIQVGAVSQPLEGDDGSYLVRILERQPGAAPPFDSAREVAVSEWRRRAGEERLRRFLDERRARSEVVEAKP